MELKDQVCSLELSKKLLILGVKQESILSWIKRIDDSWVISSYYGCNCWVSARKEYPDFNHEECAAFTASELGNMLPNNVTTKEGEPFNNFRIAISKFISLENNVAINNFIVNYECDSTAITGEEAWLRRKLTVNIYDANLANALAKMLIYLLENNLIDTKVYIPDNAV